MTSQKSPAQHTRMIPAPSGMYHFITTWHVEATCEAVYRLLEQVESLPVWWPSVYLEVAVTAPGEPGGVGKCVDLFTKGWLPYTLRWSFTVTETAFPNGFSLRAAGDFAGAGVWTFVQNGPVCEITYDWKISAEKPLLKKLTWLLRPVFAANHEWAMRKGFESLLLELRRRNGDRHVPPPPPPTFRW